MATLLVADDDPSILSLTTDVLRAAGHVVHAVLDGALAIAVFELHQPSIQAVLMDVFMPGVDGVAAFQEIRRRRRDIPFLFVSGTLANLPVEVRAAPRVAVLTKPFHIVDLVAAVDQVLAFGAESAR
jgi:CheY-like chemotaxis protein